MKDTTSLETILQALDRLDGIELLGEVNRYKDCLNGYQLTPFLNRLSGWRLIEAGRDWPVNREALLKQLSRLENLDLVMAGSEWKNKLKRCDYVPLFERLNGWHFVYAVKWWPVTWFDFAKHLSKLPGDCQKAAFLAYEFRKLEEKRDKII